MKIREEAYQYYFYFLQERMNIFWRRYEGATSGLTADPILAGHKFTNVYRAADRVSQYLIKNIAYGEVKDKEEDVLLRILIFKIFNNIATWEFLESAAGPISYSNFSVEKLSSLLSERIKYTPIFSAAYMMTGSHSKYKMYISKHEKWLRMVEKEMIQGKVLNKLARAKSLQQIYLTLNNCSFIGDFLAYQYAIDFNYSAIFDFDENSFVKAGIGAIRGIKKCFLGDSFSYEDCINYTHENLEKFQRKYGYDQFRDLFGREPKLIDLQNCFCETDKYLRVKMPELQVDNIRIKQKFTSPRPAIRYFFPPKWGINKKIKS